ncbi:hypothetical protein K469DRAFT_717718 [Zopfia rhizophila CBS 207.26]|uniref:Uncharacterized protein n=1 Tax=Zopfia rhizophila CBS 207.26 TaxID=1314779 RepID=A0A6A6DKF3_9PEZI|nr:hypothetical protein K469DRAFT_717718 [Zopfia rhizophila CBS 207.26]
MEDSTRLRRVSPLYGPGTVGGWLFILFSVLVTWSANLRSRKKDTITNDLIATLSLPAIASINLFYELHQFSGSIRDLLISEDNDIQEFSASIEAPLNVCETFSAFAITLVAISSWHGHRKRALSAFTIGVLCFSTEIILLIGSLGTTTSTVNFARPFVFNIVGLMISIVIFLVLLSVPFLVCLFASHISNPDSPAEDQMQREYAAVKWRGITTYMTFSFALLAMPLTMLNGIGLLAETAYRYQSYISFKSRILFFIPRTSSSITDLDQAVALAGGMVTLGFSIYEALKSIFAQETEDFERWKRFRSSARRINGRRPAEGGGIRIHSQTEC